MPHPDAYFFVWRRGLRGPTPSVDMFNPNSMQDKQHEANLIAVIPLTDEDRHLTFSQVALRYPCPVKS